MGAATPRSRERGFLICGDFVAIAPNLAYTPPVVRFSHRNPPAIEDLPRLCMQLRDRLDRLEGSVKQLQAQATAATLGRLTLRDLDEIKQDIEELRRSA